MKLINLIAVLILSIPFSYGQGFNVKVGGNASIAGVLTDGSVSGVDLDQDTSAVLATMIPFSVEFSPIKFVSLSAGFRTGRWLNEDPNDPDENYKITKQKTNQLLFGVKLYPVRKENFDLYFGFDFGVGGFDKSTESTGIVNWDSSQSWRGTSTNLNVGLDWYFGGKFGMFYQMGYTGYKLDLKEYTLNNSDVLSDLEYKAKADVKGVQVELGFCYKFGSIDY